MPRVIFKNNNQREFLSKVKSLSGLSNEELALLCHVCGRTFRDWLRGKFNISEKAFLFLLKKSGLAVPKDIKVVNDFWYVMKGARNGALKRMELYGPPGTSEGRKKGGINSQLRRKENPNKYRLLGCNLRKEFRINNSSVNLAEATGIILGDGSISPNQLTITLGIKTDRLYAMFVSNLFQEVFGERPSLREDIDDNTIRLALSGVGLIEELIRWGFKKGDKVRQQVDFPYWIWKDTGFQKGCVRGLMDTDGGCYFHKHKTKLPIVSSVAKVLKSLRFKFSLSHGGTRIYIYDFEEIKRYFELIGSSNPKNHEKFKYYLSQKTHRI